jgi:hypothetical protein
MRFMPAYDASVEPFGSLYMPEFYSVENPDNVDGLD